MLSKLLAMIKLGKLNIFLLICFILFFRNEEGVGTAVKKSGIARKDVFVVTKLMNHGRQICFEHCKQSLAKLVLN